MAEEVDLELQPPLVPASGASPAALEAASRSQDRFLEIVGAIVGAGDARRYGALLMAGAHGIASMELSGHLSEAKWGTTGDELVATLVASLPGWNADGPPSRAARR